MFDVNYVFILLFSILQYFIGILNLLIYTKLHLCEYYLKKKVLSEKMFLGLHYIYRRDSLIRLSYKTKLYLSNL